MTLEDRSSYPTSIEAALRIDKLLHCFLGHVYIAFGERRFDWWGLFERKNIYNNGINSSSMQSAYHHITIYRATSITTTGWLIYVFETAKRNKEINYNVDGYFMLKSTASWLIYRTFQINYYANIKRQTNKQNQYLLSADWILCSARKWLKSQRWKRNYWLFNMTT